MKDNGLPLVYIFPKKKATYLGGQAGDQAWKFDRHWVKAGHIGYTTGRNVEPCDVGFWSSEGELYSGCQGFGGDRIEWRISKTESSQSGKKRSHWLSILVSKKTSVIKGSWTAFLLRKVKVCKWSLTQFARHEDHTISAPLTKTWLSITWGTGKLG